MSTHDSSTVLMHKAAGSVAGVYVQLWYRIAGFRKYGIESICGWMQRKES